MRLSLSGTKNIGANNSSVSKEVIKTNNEKSIY